MRKLTLKRLKEVVNNDTGKYDAEFQSACKEVLLTRKYMQIYMTTRKVRDLLDLNVV
jgi:hypothetical protein